MLLRLTCLTLRQLHQLLPSNLREHLRTRFHLFIPSPQSDLTETWLVVTHWKTCWKPWQKELGSSYVWQTILSGRHTTVTIQSSVKVETRQINSLTYHESDTGIQSYFEKLIFSITTSSCLLTSFIHGKEITPSRSNELFFIPRTLSFFL